MSRTSYECLIESQIEILRRICDRGRDMFAFKDSRVTDMFQHMEDELERLRLMIIESNQLENKDGQP